jgi:hypothetical protein
MIDLRFGDDGELWHLAVILAVSVAMWVGIAAVINAIL